MAPIIFVVSIFDALANMRFFGGNHGAKMNVFPI